VGKASEFEQKLASKGQEVRRELEGPEALISLIEYTLTNFAYRYLESEGTGELASVRIAENSYAVFAYEPSMAQALKTNNQDLRAGVIDLARTTTKRDSPKVQYCIGCKLQNSKELKIWASANWDFPEFVDGTKKSVQKIETLEFDDVLEVRNKLPLVLEKVCDLF
jgi:hypothetical protein